MTEASPAQISPERRLQLEARIIALLKREIQDKEAVLTRDTRRDDVVIDSIDIVHVIFAVEEEFGILINLSVNAKFETVGDLLDMFISFIPAHDDESPKSETQGSAQQA
jgi:acyl carrier protein